MTTEKLDKLKADDLFDVSDYSEIMGVNLEKKTREQQTVWARYAVWMYLLDECDAKLTEVARHFGWKHTAIIYGVNQIKQKLEIGDSIAFENTMRIYRADPHERYPIQRGRARTWLK